MSLVNNKMPVSLLLELCVKKSITPKYDAVIVSSGFAFKITLGDQEVLGQGMSKKKAKHNAALLMIKKLFKSDAPDMSEIEVGEMLADNCSETSVNDTSNERNYIGELQEKLQKAGVTPPIYTYTDDLSTTPKRFICTINTTTHNVTAIGKTKKLSKQEAAKKFIDSLKDQPLVEQKPMSSSISTTTSLPSVASQRITEFYENNNLTIKSALKGLQSLNLDSNRPSKSLAAKTEISYVTAASTQEPSETDKEDPPQQEEKYSTANKHYLEELCKQQRYRMRYIKVKDRNEAHLPNPACLVMLRIDSNPPAVFTGEGTTWEMAENKAAYSSLDYLKQITSKYSGTSFQ